MRTCVRVAYPPYLREKARSMRGKRHFTIDQIAERLVLSRSTVFGWVRDIPMPRSHFDPGPAHAARLRGNRAMQAKRRALREQAYAEGQASFEWLTLEPTELASFWAEELTIEPSAVRFQRKSNSGQLNKRTWRCQYGVLTVRTCDTLVRSQLEAWMDRLRASWV